MVNNAPAFIGAPGFLISQALMLPDSEFPVGVKNGAGIYGSLSKLYMDISIL